MNAFWQEHKLLLSGLGGLIGGVFFLSVIFDGVSRGEAMTFSRHLAWFAQSDRPADFVASVLLHTCLSAAIVISSVGAIGKYFYLFWPPSRKLMATFLGFVGATMILFFANFGPFPIIGFPVLMLFGFPLGLLLGGIWPAEFSGGFLPAVGSGQLAVALGYILGFLAWWALLAFLANRRLYRLELE